MRPKSVKSSVRTSWKYRPQALAILEAYGITEDDVNSWGGKVITTSISEAMRMLADGQADMWFTGGSYFPHPKYVQLGAQHSFKLMPISKAVAAEVGKKFGQDIMEVPAGVYADANGKNPPYWSPATILTFGVLMPTESRIKAWAAPGWRNAASMRKSYFLLVGPVPS